MVQSYQSLLVSGTTGWHDGSGVLSYTFLGAHLPGYYPRVFGGYDVSGFGDIVWDGQSFAMSPQQQAMMIRAIEAWDEVANVNLQPGTIGSGNVGDLAFGAVRFSYTGLFGFVSGFPEPDDLGETPSTAGDIWINTSNPHQFVPGMGPIFGHTSWNTYLHELGHALGLRHPNESPNDPATNNQFTVMSYVPHPGVENEALIDQAFSLTPMVWDIQALQELYGANTSTRTGDTVYFGDGAEPADAGQHELAYQYGANAMTVIGEDGNDRSVILAIWDAGGTDLIDASGQSTDSAINLAPGEYSTIGSIENNIGLAAAVTHNGQVINYIENAWAGLGDDTIHGNAAQNDLRGNDGNDSLSGLSGDDTLYGNAGADTLLGGTGHDLLGAGSGNDMLEGGRGNDRVFTGTGDDTAHGGDGNDVLGGAGGHDLLTGDLGADALWGSDGNDTLMGGRGADTLGGAHGADALLGGLGADVLWGAGGIDTLWGGEGADQIGVGSGDDEAWGGDGNDLIFGGLGNDMLYGNRGNDTLYGAGGDDVLDGGAGDDQIFGGAGQDVFVFSPWRGNDSVVAFSVSEDTLDLSETSRITDFADLQANHLTEVEGDTVIDDGAGSTLTLTGITLADLQADSFLF